LLQPARLALLGSFKGRSAPALRESRAASLKLATMYSWGWSGTTPPFQTWKVPVGKRQGSVEGAECYGAPGAAVLDDTNNNSPSYSLRNNLQRSIISSRARNSLQEAEVNNNNNNSAQGSNNFNNMMSVGGSDVLPTSVRTTSTTGGNGTNQARTSPPYARRPYVKPFMSDYERRPVYMFVNDYRRPIHQTMPLALAKPVISMPSPRLPLSASKGVASNRLPRVTT